MDKVFIQNLHVEGILGVYERERTTPRKILINVTLFTDTRSCAQTDNLSNGVDYSLVVKEIRDHVKKVSDIQWRHWPRILPTYASAMLEFKM